LTPAILDPDAVLGQEGTDRPMERAMKRLLPLIALFAAAQARAEVPEVRLARQYSMGYLQLNVIEHEHLIQKHAAAHGIPEVKVSFSRFNGTPAMTDALLSGSLDIVSGAMVGLFPIWAKTRGTPMEVRAIGTLATMPVMLNSNDPDIRTMADIGKCKKIPVPAVRVSIGAVLVQLAAAKVHGIKDATIWDNATVSLSPADATVALMAGNSGVNCAVSFPPFTQQQLERPEIHTVANSYDLMGGPSSYTVAYTSKVFHDKNPKLFRAVYEAMEEATDRVNQDLKTAARYWIEDSESKLSVDFVAAAGGGKDVHWTMTPERSLVGAEFMAEIGTIKVKPESWKDYFFSEAWDRPGS
jgi:NitT/TauT family transport system substrate-binding protein